MHHLYHTTVSRPRRNWEKKCSQANRIPGTSFVFVCAWRIEQRFESTHCNETTCQRGRRSCSAALPWSCSCRADYRQAFCGSVGFLMAVNPLVTVRPGGLYSTVMDMSIVHHPQTPFLSCSHTFLRWIQQGHVSFYVHVSWLTMAMFRAAFQRQSTGYFVTPKVWATHPWITIFVKLLYRIDWHLWRKGGILLLLVHLCMGLTPHKSFNTRHERVLH